MASLTWKTGIFESGLNKGVLNVASEIVAWNGLLSLDETYAVEGESTVYLDGRLRVVGGRRAEFSAALRAKTYPKQFEKCLGYSDYYDGAPRTPFNLSYQTGGSSTKTHFVYNAVVRQPSITRSNSTGVESEDFVFDITARPSDNAVLAPAAHYYLDSAAVSSYKVQQVHDRFYGTSLNDPAFPSISDIAAILESEKVLTITDHGNGLWTAEGPDEMVRMIGASEFEISAGSVVYISDGTYTVEDE